MDPMFCLLQARWWGERRHSGASPLHHAAFANSVTYLVTGSSEGFGGPSMRELAACFAGDAEGVPGEFEYQRAVEICEPVCYGPLTVEIAGMLALEHCFDDAQGEQEEARRLLEQ